MKRVLLIILDSAGVGELPDANLFGDAGSNTLGHIMQVVPGIKIPNLMNLGLKKILDGDMKNKLTKASGAFGKMAEKSQGKDTTAGHWEIAGVISEKAMPTFPQGFPKKFVDEFEQRINRKTLGNKTASGTAIIEELGKQHMLTGYPIIYTSADSVFQIAAHEETIPLPELYAICKIARELLTGPLAVGRVIARPFIGSLGKFSRTAHRHDFSLLPPEPTILDALKSENIEVVGIGKISDIFAGRGLTASFPTISNRDGYEKTKQAWGSVKTGLVFVNLVEFDSSYGHRNDPQGYAKALEEFDLFLPEIMEMLKKDDLLIITADHGNDPTTSSTDHSREYVPLLVGGQKVAANLDLGVRATFADIAATIDEVFQAGYKSPGKSFLSELYRER